MCRMNLQVITLSDITTSTGKQICPFAIKGERHPHRPSTYKWPNQTNIAQKYWNIWETCVKDTFCSNQTRLSSPLKDWIQGAESSQQWQTFADHDSCNLIWITGEGDSRECREHKMVPTNKYLVYNKGKGETTQQPPALYKISLLSQSPRSWVYQKSGSSPFTGNNKEQIQTLIPKKEKPTYK